MKQCVLIYYFMKNHNHPFNVEISKEYSSCLQNFGLIIILEIFLSYIFDNLMRFVHCSLMDSYIHMHRCYLMRFMHAIFTFNRNKKLSYIKILINHGSIRRKTKKKPSSCSEAS